MGTAEARPGIKPGDLVLDRYRVIEQIASGGHSVVYLGTDERLSRPVCIKLFSGLGGKSGVGRTSYEHFVQEAFALSRLTHPNTLRIYDFGHLGSKDVEGMPLQVCEYMNAGTLSNVVREQGTQTLAETVRVMAAMCAALSEAHALGIVHRDIKPQNILFGTVGANKLPKLADFGIAKWSDEQTGETEQRAQDTQIVAGQKLAMYSPSWAAPEQLAGQPVSAQTDIYSLAVVAVYMLSGRAIFADEDVYAGYKKRRHADEHVRDALVPLKIPKVAIALLTKALAFDPKKRIAKVEELATGLAAAAEHRPSQPMVSVTEVATPTVPTMALPAVDPPAAGRDRMKRPGTEEPEITSSRDDDAPEASREPTAASKSRKSGPRPPVGAPAPFGAVPLAAQPYPVASPEAANQAIPDAVANQPSQPAVGPAGAAGAPAAPHPARPQAPPAGPQSRPASTMPAQSPTPTPVPGSHPLQPLQPGIPAASGWMPPDVRGPWMVAPTAPLAHGRRMGPSELPQMADGRRVHFLLTPGQVVDLIGGQGKVRVTLMSSPKGARVVHIKGLTCFVSHVGGRPSPAVQLDQPSDIALVTPRAQEIGHIRVAIGTPSADGTLVFAIGAESVAVAPDDCSDPILFDFGPGSDAYFVYTRGRPVPVGPPPRPRRR